MPVQYHYDADNKIIETNAHGRVTVNEITDYLEALMADEQVEYGSTEIFSLEQATDLEMRYSELEIFNILWRRYKQRIGQRVIVIAPGPLSYGLFRMLTSVIATSDADAADAFEIVSSREEITQQLT